MMPKSAEKLYVRCTIFLLASLLVLSAMPIFAFASDVSNSNEEQIVLTGSFEGTFDLGSNTSDLFHLEGIVPGDTWNGKIHIKNDTAWDMDVALLTIKSNLEDIVLFDSLTLDIVSEGKSIYSGSYNTGLDPIVDYKTLAPKETMTLDVTVTLPITTGNKVLNKSMDSTWTFEAHCDAKAGKPQTGNNLVAENTASLFILLILLLAALAAGVVTKRIRIFKEVESNETKEVSRK